MSAAREFAPGDRVIVRRAWPPGHVRTPAYIRGHAGVVERRLGAFPNPEDLAFRRSGLPASTLYRVRFRQAEIWPDYAGPPGDTIEIELYRTWLEPAWHPPGIARQIILVDANAQLNRAIGVACLTIVG